MAGPAHKHRTDGIDKKPMAALLLCLCLVMDQTAAAKQQEALSAAKATKSTKSSKAAASGVIPAAGISSAADPNGQGRLLYAIGRYLTGNDVRILAAWGWSPTGNPCLGTWQGVTCNKRGYITTINLAHKGLKGSLPNSVELWSGLRALRDIDVSGNILSGPVPAAISAAGPQLENIDLSGNIELCGGRLAGLPGLIADNTNIDMDCLGFDVSPQAVTPQEPATPAAAATSTAPPAAQAAAAATAAQLPATQALSSNATGNSVSTAADAQARASLSGGSTTAGSSSAFTPVDASTQSSSTADSPLVARIGRPEPAPICSCAQNGFGSPECSAAMTSICARTMRSHPLCSQVTDVVQDVKAAKQLATLLEEECFIGQDLDTRICGCVKSLMGSECAKARVALCVKQDPLCLPFQNIVHSNSSTSARAVSIVAAVMDRECPIAEPTVQGVKATIEFPELTIETYIKDDYTLNVANALSSVAAVPSTAVSGLDVRPLASTYAPHKVSPARSFLMRRNELLSLAGAPNPAAAAAATGAASASPFIHVLVKTGIRIVAPSSSNSSSNSTSSNSTSSGSSTGSSNDSSNDSGSSNRRQLLQSAAAVTAVSSGLGVQATYFIETEDPSAVSQAISSAGAEGLLSTRLEQYGVSSPVGGLIIELFMLAPGQKPPLPYGAVGYTSEASNSNHEGTTSAGYALALVAIIAGSVLLCAGLAYVAFWCWRCKKAQKTVGLLMLGNNNKRVKPITSFAPVMKTTGAIKAAAAAAATSGSTAAGAAASTAGPAGGAACATAISVPGARAGGVGAAHAQLPNADRDALLPRSFDYPAPSPQFALPPNFSQAVSTPSSFSSAVAAAMSGPAAAVAAAAAGTASAARTAAAAAGAAVAAVAAAATSSTSTSQSTQEKRANAAAAATGGAAASSHVSSSRAGSSKAAAVKQQRLASGISGATVSFPKASRSQKSSPTAQKASASAAAPAASAAPTGSSSLPATKLTISTSGSNDGLPVSYSRFTASAANPAKAQPSSGNNAPPASGTAAGTGAATGAGGGVGQVSANPGSAAPSAGGAGAAASRPQAGAGQRSESNAGGKPVGRLMGHREALQAAAAAKKESTVQVAFGSTVSSGSSKSSTGPVSRWWT